MKKLILLMSFIAGSVFMAYAQAPMVSGGQQKTPGQRAESTTRILLKRLNLNHQQEQRVYTAYREQATRMDSLKSNLSVDKKLNRLTAHTISLTTQQSVMAILNDSQRQLFMEWEKMKKDRRIAKRDTVGVKL